ncbi:SET domain-containing protein [Niabella sp. CC-SYL272]|uniref:SET domain-containing protein n=1 Tax=Niabella agricola TaxID=2891571 RepID=UPI001F31D163|nr:SET domain-containing protein [Niabella agricola]MCF3107851.1 SET domain-containing protein [Niabella agricola]
MIASGLYIAQTEKMGRGVFTSVAITAGSVIEVAPVIVMSQRERELLDQTLLHDYIFEWGAEGEQCAMALGWVAVYNHSYRANCDYEMDYTTDSIQIITVRDIQAGEELFINYGGSWDEQKPVWFETR